MDSINKLISQIKHLWKEEDFRNLIKVLVALKIILLILGVGSQLIPLEYTHRQLRSENILLNPWMQYDAWAFVDIAKNGYNFDYLDGGGNFAWYPLYPVAIRMLAFVGYDTAAFLISNVAFFVAVTLLYVLLREDFGSKTAYRSLVFLGLFPTAYFFTAAYSESLFLLLVAASFLAAKKEKWKYAGIFGFLAALTRVQGIVLFPVFVFMHLRQNKYKLRFGWGFLVPFTPIAGFLSLMVYHYLLTGNFFAQLQTQQEFGRHLSFLWVSVYNLFYWIFTASDVKHLAYLLFSLFTFLLFLGLLYAGRKRIPKEYTVYLGFSMMIPMTVSTLLAITKYVLVMFPGFVVLAVLYEKGVRHRAPIKVMYALFLVLLVIFTIRHGNEELFLLPLGF